MTPAPTLSPAPSVSVAPSPFLPPSGGVGGGGNCADYGNQGSRYRNGTLDIAAESSVVLGKGINIKAEAANKFWAVFAGSGKTNCVRDTFDTYVTINGTVAESKYGAALLASDGTAVTMCDGHFQGGTYDRSQRGVEGFYMPGPGYLQMACGSILAGNSYSDYVPSPALILEDTLFESNITGGNIIGGYWPKADNDWWENRGPSMFIGTRESNINPIYGSISKPLSVHVNIFGGNFEGNCDLYPRSQINVYGYDLELSEDDEMPCPPYFNYGPPDTTTCKVLTGYLCDDSPINMKIRFISGENSFDPFVYPVYNEFNTKGNVTLFNDVNCKKAVPKIDGCGMQKCKKSAKSGKQDIFG